MNNLHQPKGFFVHMRLALLSLPSYNALDVMPEILPQIVPTSNSLPYPLSRIHSLTSGNRKKRRSLLETEQETKRDVVAPLQSKLFLGDCLTILERLPDNSIDCLLTDPPYGFNYRSRSHKLPLTRIANDRHEAIPLLRRSLHLMYPKLKENGICFIFTNWQCYHAMSKVTEQEGYEIKNVLIWEKNAWSRGDLKGNFGYTYEMILFCKKKTTPPRLRRFLQGKREGNILKFKKLPTNTMQHPTEKPVELLKYLIEKTTLPGEMVLDMFMGVGSTCVAAKQIGRRYIGIEIEKTWFEVAAKRLKEDHAS